VFEDTPYKQQQHQQLLLQWRWWSQHSRCKLKLPCRDNRDSKSKSTTTIVVPVVRMVAEAGGGGGVADANVVPPCAIVVDEIECGDVISIVVSYSEDED
jgi:hypothetical protein